MVLRSDWQWAGETAVNDEFGIFFAPIKKSGFGGTKSSSNLTPTLLGNIIGTWENLGSIQLGPDNKIHFNTLSSGNLPNQIVVKGYGATIPNEDPTGRQPGVHPRVEIIMSEE